MDFICINRLALKDQPFDRALNQCMRQRLASLAGNFQSGTRPDYVQQPTSIDQLT